MRQLALLFMLASAFAQTSPVPYAPDSDGPGPTFTIDNEGHPYPGAYSSIRKVDFRNLRFPEQAGYVVGGFSLKNGRYKEGELASRYSIDLDAVHYFSTSSSSNGEAALILLSESYGGGSSVNNGIAQVFVFSDRQLRSVQKIDWDTHFDAGQPYVSFAPRTKTLVIRSAHYIPGDAHCCVSAMDVVTFRWDGRRFAQVDLRTELSEYGKEEGKTLPKLPKR